MKRVPSERVRACNDKPVRPDGSFVVYWMIAFRRPYYNFALQRAVEIANDLGKPVLVLEALRTGYRWASDRFHRFILDGMRANRDALESGPIHYMPYVEPDEDAGKGLLAALTEQACAVVTDDFPCFFLPRMVATAAGRCPVQMEAIDSNGLLPLDQPGDKVFSRAYDFRRHLQKVIHPYVEPDAFPKAVPWRGLTLPRLDSLSKAIRDRWPAASNDVLAGTPDALSALPIDHSVGIVEDRPGGWKAARDRLAWFLDDGLPRYADDRNEPTQEVTSGLSPYLHFGNISIHEIFEEAMAREEDWSPAAMGSKATGKFVGWWGAQPYTEGFLDEAVTWREVGFNMTHRWDNYDKYESLPNWARTTLEDHENDPREWCYSLQEFDAATTHDQVWNAAQAQLVREGRIHNYMRMVWGKKILEWSRSPREALSIMIELNNKYGLDGRNPNSYSGIFWCLGRYDRAWGPERDIVGKVRYMSTDNTRRKLKLDGYLKKYAPATGGNGGRGLFD